MLRNLVLATALVATPALAHAADWTVDPAHSTASFTVKHMMVSTVRGQVGKIGSMPVLASDRATAVADVDPGAGTVAGYNALLVKKGALALKYKRRPIVETDRDILKRTNLITTNVHYAVKRVDDRGVVIIPTNDVVPTPTA